MLSTELIQLIFERVNIGLQILHLENSEDPGSLRQLDVNLAACRITGVDMKKDNDKTWNEVSPELVNSEFGKKILETATTGYKTSWEIEYGDSKFDKAWWKGEAIQLKENLVLIQFEDITESKLTQLQLLEIIENAIFPILVVNKDKSIVKINKKWLLHCGFNSNPFQSLTEWLKQILPSSYISVEDKLLSVFQSGFVKLSEKILTKSGEFRSWEIFATQLYGMDGDRASAVIMAKDVTTELELHTQLIESQKVESLGMLAGGIAHDFNNLLTIIRGYGVYVNDALSKDDKLKPKISELLKASDRAITLTEQLLTYSRKKIIEPKVTNFNIIVDGAISLLRRIIGEDVDLELNKQPDLWNVKVDKGSFEQVIVNLSVNAKQAMPEGGQLTIETKNVQLEEGMTVAKGKLVSPGDYVQLAVSDNGTGINPSIIDAIFEPFFTTKQKKSGTGLGLSVCYGIIKQAGGYIAVYSEVGIGTTFKIYLPRVNKAIEKEVIPRIQVKENISGTILLVEDDEQLRNFTQLLLKDAKFTILAAGSFNEALDVFDKTSDTIDLVLTDVILSDATGKEVTDIMRVKRPDLKVIYMSGYPTNVIGKYGILDESVNFIQKPFNKTTLIGKIIEVLGRQ